MGVQQLCPHSSTDSFDLPARFFYNETVQSDSQVTSLPASILLAADARLGGTSYPDDQIWELRAGGPEQVPALQTTYGLRAKTMRVFPRFLQGGAVREDLPGYDRPPRIVRSSVSFCSLEFSPFPGIDVQAEYWVPGSQVIAGRIRMENRTSEPQSCRFELAVLLVPFEGQGMVPIQAQASFALAGKTGNLYPVLFLTGGPEPGSGPYPSLTLEFHLDPGKSRRVAWALAAQASQEVSLQAARQATAGRWEAAAARVELQDRRDTLTIETGNPAWDAVLAHSQTAARRLFQSPGNGLPYPSIVLARLPEMGYSRRGDGSDYNYLWNGQPALETLFISKNLLPGAASLVEGLLLNFFTRDLPDWKPGLAGQASRLLAAPVLAELAWVDYSVTRSRALLEKVFPHLRAYLEAWFSPAHDRDQDGYPEWDHIVQTGLEENPLFARGVPWGQGVDPVLIESPALAAFLFNDCQRLAEIASALDRTEDAQPLLSSAEKLREELSRAWDGRRGVYSYRDRDSHSSRSGTVLFDGQPPYEIILEQPLPEPARLAIRILSAADGPRPVELRIAGKDRSGEEQAESFPFRETQWLEDRAVLTSRSAYSYLSRIQLQGFGPTDQIVVETVDYAREDLTLFLPLWAGMPGPEQVEEMVARSLTDPERYGHPFGLSTCPGAVQPDGAAGPSMAPVLWNGFVIEGLVRCGRREEAAKIFTGLMEAMSACLRTEGCLRPYYHAVTGKPFGERDHAAGLFPAGIFLELLGIELISPNEMRISGINPFPGKVTVQYRGTKITRDAGSTQVIFRDGKTATLESPGTYHIIEKEGALSAQAADQEAE